jgi:hypothetical protein
MAQQQNKKNVCNNLNKLFQVNNEDSYLRI